MLEGKHIIIGVTGSIAAFKAATLVRLLIKNKAQVKVVMTPLAEKFITPLTLSTLSNNPVYCDFFTPDTGEWHSHVSLGVWADLMVIAPATANTLGKMAHGIADNLLLTTFLSARCPVFAAPAMDLDMYQHPLTQKNLDVLRSVGVTLIEPAMGELASGLVGKGRMEEPEVILEKIFDFFQAGSSEKNALSGKKILVTAGPTYERIDPVRFIGNFSTGKMGYALAMELAQQGAEVTLVSGPTSLDINHPLIKRISVESAAQMHKACLDIFRSCDGAILSAAVADFTPLLPSGQKVKRTRQNYSIELKPTDDIASDLGKIKEQKQFLVGFALETENEVENAQSKLKKKNLDFIVLNSLRDKGAGFATDTNKITIIDAENHTQRFELKSKQAVAKDIVNEIIRLIQ